ANTGMLDLFASYAMPDGTEYQWRIMTDMLRISATPEDAEHFLTSIVDVDVTSAARGISVPTLVVHARGDQLVPVELGRQLATLIPGARDWSSSRDATTPRLLVPPKCNKAHRSSGRSWTRTSPTRPHRRSSRDAI